MPMLTNVKHKRHSGFHTFEIDAVDPDICKEINNWCISKFSLDYNMINIHYPEHYSKTIRFTVIIGDHHNAVMFADKWTPTDH